MKKQTLLRVALLAALFTQVSHAAHVFKAISNEKTNNIVDQATPYVFAVAIELAIYIFAMSGKRVIATYFAVASFLMNVLYYWKQPAFSFEFCAMLIISGLVPAIIWFYSELIKEEAVKEKARAANKRYRENKKAAKATVKTKAKAATV